MDNRRRFHLFIISLILGAAWACQPDPTPSRLVRSIGVSTFEYDNNLNLIRIHRDTETFARYEYDTEKRLISAKNFVGTSTRDSTTFQYDGNTLASSIFYQYEGNPQGQLIRTIFSDYIFDGNLLIQKDDSINLYWTFMATPDSIYSRTTSFTHQEGSLISKREVYSDDTVIDFIFQYDSNTNPMAGRYGVSTFYDSPYFVELRLANSNTLFQSQHNLTKIEYTRNKGCGFGDSGGGSLSFSFVYDGDNWPISLDRGLFDTCAGVGPDVLSFTIEYF